MSSTLLLNADMQPISLLPLSVVDWQEAIRYMVLDKAEVLEWHDNWIIHSASWETKVPAVLLLREYQKPKHTVRMSKKNVFLRDGYVCQYCNCAVTELSATLDHVHPVSKGGRTTWENSTTACKQCNYKKAATTGKMKPKTTPWKPHFWDLVANRRKRGYHITHPSWHMYLGVTRSLS